MLKPDYNIRLDEVSSSVSYVGKAAPAASETDTVWQIKKIVVTGTVTSITWASGNGRFDKQWSLRATYTYS